MSQQQEFTAYVCILPVKPSEPIGPYERRHPLVHKELFLSQADAAEWAYFENVDEPAPDAVEWIVREVKCPPLLSYLGDEPFVPEEEAVV